MPDLSWAEKVRIVHQRADFCCEYCRTCQKVCGQSMHIEHIDPDAGDDLDNLCLSCPSCNFSKSRVISAPDPQTGKLATLYHPRQQIWVEHFEWYDLGARIQGKTAIGRATVERLKMNIDRIVAAREIWIKAGEHPPQD